jgi:mono/diheme cytochrome c family protein
MRQQTIALGGLVLLIIGFLSLAACGTAETEEQPGLSAGDSAAVAETAGLPVRAPQGPIDEQLASRGAQLFKERGCVACHTIGGGRLVGPDLVGVTDRREFEWFYHMVMHPDSMIQSDPAARQLFAEYATPMTNMNVAQDEVVPLWEHVRLQSSKSAEGDSQ